VGEAKEKINDKNCNMACNKTEYKQNPKVYNSLQDAIASPLGSKVLKS